MKIKGKDAFARQLAALPAAMKAEIRQAIETSAQEMVDVAKRFVPVDSGDLRDSIGYSMGGYTPENSNVRGVSTGVVGKETTRGNARYAKQKAGLSATVHAGNAKAWYASLVEHGTAPHEIRPRRPGGLLNVNGKPVLEVQHPGATASPFFFPAYRLTKKRAGARLARAMNKGAKKALGK